MSVWMSVTLFNVTELIEIMRNCLITCCFLLWSFKALKAHYQKLLESVESTHWRASARFLDVASDLVQQAVLYQETDGDPVVPLHQVFPRPLPYKHGKPVVQLPAAATNSGHSFNVWPGGSRSGHRPSGQLQLELLALHLNYGNAVMYC